MVDFSHRRRLLFFIFWCIFYTWGYLLKAGIDIEERSDMILCTLKAKRHPQEGVQEKFKCKKFKLFCFRQVLVKDNEELVPKSRGYNQNEMSWIEPK